MENKLKRGDKVLYNGQVCIIQSIPDISNIQIKSVNNGQMSNISINDLNPLNTVQSEIELSKIPKSDWDEALRKFRIIKPLLDIKRTEKDVVETSKQHNIGAATVYRWLKKYESNHQLTSLLKQRNIHENVIYRLDDKSDEIINKVLHYYYFTKEARTIQSTYTEIKRVCLNEDIPIPSISTVRNRILSISEREKVQKRYGVRSAEEKFNPKTGSFPNANHALQVIQMDHTKLDIMLIHPTTGKSIGRPWLTLAMDVYSRMVVGYYLSFDAPSILNTGICISNSILPKEKLLAEYEIDAEWPCWGIMETIHVDNGKDFRSIAVERACMEYGINLEFRPVKKPEYGAHIERLLGTVITELNNVPGKTFNNIKSRRNYNSEKKATLTYYDLNKWLLTFFTQVYHYRKHSQIGTSPLNLFKESLLGNDNVKGIGIPKRVTNPQKLYIDFLPSIERSIQNYGIVIDHIEYYSDVLRNYIHSVEKQYVNSNKQVKKKFVFKRDPRDISRVFFYDETTKTYYEISYRDMSLPSITLWELRSIKKYLSERHEPIDERKIFEGINQMREIESNATKYKRSLHQKRTKEYDDIKNNNEVNSESEEIDFDNLSVLKSEKNYGRKD